MDHLQRDIQCCPRVAVYGTLKQGCHNHYWLEGATLLGRDRLTALTPYDLRGQSVSVSTRMRLPFPRRISSVIKMPASSVLPNPTASAIRIRWRFCLSACSAGSSWYGTGSMAALWPRWILSSTGVIWRSWVSINRRLFSKPGIRSCSKQVSSGSST